MIAAAAELSELWAASVPEEKEASGAVATPALESARVEERVLSIYRVAALSARTAPDDAVTAIWQAMVEVCGQACAVLSKLKAQWPQCGVSHDRILDVRNRCQRLADWHS